MSHNIDMPEFGTPDPGGRQSKDLEPLIDVAEEYADVKTLLHDIKVWLAYHRYEKRPTPKADVRKMKMSFRQLTAILNQNALQLTHRDLVGSYMALEEELSN